MTTPLRKFWPALEMVVGLSAVSAEWSRLLCDELPWTLRAGFLRCGGVLSTSYPRHPDTDPSLVPYDVVKYADDDYVGVCPDGWESVPLTREQLLLWDLDRRRLAAAVATSLGLSFSFEPDVQPFTSRIGTYGSGGSALPVYLVLGVEALALTAAAASSLASHGPAVLVAPTRRLLTEGCQQLIRARGRCFAALNELLPVVGADGRFVQTRALSQLLARRYPAPQQGGNGEAGRPDGYYFPSTVVWQGREYECVLSKKEAEFFLKAHSNDETDAQQLMYRGKGAVWNKRYTNAKAKRDLISKLISRINGKFRNASPSVPVMFALRRGYDCVTREALNSIVDGTSAESPR